MLIYVFVRVWFQALVITRWEYNVVHPRCKMSIRSLILNLLHPFLTDVHRGRSRTWRTNGEYKEGYIYRHLGVCFGSSDWVSIVTAQKDACYVAYIGGWEWG